MNNYLHHMLFSFEEYLPCVHFCEREPNLEKFVSVAHPSFRIWKHDLTTHALTEDAFLIGIGKSLQFPEYYGKNWNAFVDCVTDFHWAEAPGHCLIIENAQVGWATNPSVLGYFVENLECCVDRWKNYGMRFHVVFVLDKASI